MYFVYIIQSQLSGRYYIGMTADIETRIIAHNSGSNRSTKNKGPWVLKYVESLPTKAEAYKRERKIKSYKGGNAFKKLINIG